MVGIKISRMNPNLCTVCETFFSRVYGKKRRIFPATVLFADLRGYTSMSEDTASEDVVDMLDSFYDECADAIWERDGVVNSSWATLFWPYSTFPTPATTTSNRLRWPPRTSRSDGHSERGWKRRRPLGIGIGIHTGQASIGEIGRACKEFTITGPVVNMASRIQGAAQSGEILLSEDVYRRVAGIVPPSEQREVQLKGIDRPVPLHRSMPEARPAKAAAV